MTFRFSPDSLAQLDTCDPRLVHVLTVALSISPVDFKVLVGHRGELDQNLAFENGHSKKRWPYGKHNATPSLAADVAPVPIDWKDLERFVFLAGVIMAAAKMEGIALRAGVDWDGDGRMLAEHFRDYGHFELMPTLPPTVET